MHDLAVLSCRLETLKSDNLNWNSCPQTLSEWRVPTEIYSKCHLHGMSTFIRKIDSLNFGCIFLENPNLDFWIQNSIFGFSPKNASFVLKIITLTLVTFPFSVSPFPFFFFFFLFFLAPCFSAGSVELGFSSATQFSAVSFRFSSSWSSWESSADCSSSTFN